MANSNSHEEEVSVTMLTEMPHQERIIEEEPLDLEQEDDGENKVRSFSMFEVLERPLADFIVGGDGVDALPVYEEQHHENAVVVDTTLINLAKFLATAYGRTNFTAAYNIHKRIVRDNKVKKKTLRFRSRHPLFKGTTNQYQNMCLISGMIHLKIPILPYFDGEKVLSDDDDASELFAKMVKARGNDIF